MKHLIFVVVVLSIAGCPGKFNNPQSAEYPCGPKGISCSQHECCWQQEECGGQENGSLSCPSGMCCWVGPTDISSMSGPDPYKRRHPMIHVP